MLAAATSPGPLVGVMKPKTMYRIALVLGSQAAGLPATLFGIPVIASNTPAQITLLDPSAMIYSDSGNLISMWVRKRSYSSTGSDRITCRLHACGLYWSERLPVDASVFGAPAPATPCGCEQSRSK